MRNSLFGMGSVILCLAAAGTCAQDADGQRKLYVGLDVGQPNLDREAAFYEVSDFDDTSTAYTMRVGYRFNRYFALEGGYTDLGDFDATIPVACIPEVTCPAVGMSTSIQGFLFNAVGIWPLGEHFALNASGGLIYREFEVRTTSPGAILGSDGSDTASIMKFGIGAGVPINEHLEIALDLTHYRDIGLGFDLHFGQLFAGR